MSSEPSSEAASILIEIKDLLNKDLAAASQRLEALEQRTHSRPVQVEIVLIKARIYYLKGSPHEVQNLLEPLNTISWDTLDPLLEADFHLAYAQNLITLGKQPEGLRHAALALQQYDSLQKKEKSSSTHILFGNAYYTNAQYDLALDHYQKGLNLAESNHSPEYLRSLASIGNILYVRGQLAQSAEAKKKALVLAQEIGDLRMHTLISLNLGLNLFVLGEIQEATVALASALNTAHQIGNSLYIILIQTMLATIRMEIGELGLAQEILTELEPSVAAVTFSHARLEYDMTCANLLVLQGKLRPAYDLLLKTLHFAKETDRKLNTIEISCLFAEIAYSLGHLDHAYSQLLYANDLSLLDQSDMDRARILTTRSKLNLLANSLFEAKIQILEALKLTQKTHAVEMEYRAKLIYIQILLEMLNQSHNPAVFSEIKAQLTDALQFASTQKLLPFKVQTLVLFGLLHFSQQEYSHAAASWQEGLNLARLMSMSNYVTSFTEYLQLIPPHLGSNAREELFRELLDNKPRDAVSCAPKEPAECATYKQRLAQSPSSMDTYVYSLLRDQIYRVTRTLVQITISPLDVARIFLICYRLLDVFGPSVHLCTSPLQSDDQWLHHIQNIANIYYLTLGQGIQYHSGLFGPFPFVDQDMRALIFACFFEDKSLQDARMNQQNYCLFTLVYPTSLNPLFYDQQLITSRFDDFIRNFHDIAEISADHLLNFQRQLISELMPDQTRNQEISTKI